MCTSLDFIGAASNNKYGMETYHNEKCYLLTIIYAIID